MKKPPNLPTDAPEHNDADVSAKLGIDLKQVKLGQDFSASLGVQKEITTIPVGKPKRHEFIRVHPDLEYRAELGLLKIDSDYYLLSAAIARSIPEECTYVLLLTAITRQGTLFVWPIRLPGEDGRLDNWNTSAHTAAKLAEMAWVRVVSNCNAGYYEASKVKIEVAEPEWPTLSFEEILTRAFRGRYIDTLEHPVLKRLRGEL